ncbi:hypothetical protein G7Z17_g6079 [Cylindrodendrum hubeiense]|uniref:Extracellular membrane protein CFEM domain-containing protein n=1 Tax=Cylindrodendrum hubeiense TaxID=595255 RepID=A0A9P5HAK4_9HYPO|nr:hypothetical protein G7Z17_g6079 [Cylindrodendrum hubeiense]
MLFEDGHHVFAWALLLVGPVHATYWVNQLDEYDSLPVCAEGPVSSIVRDMVSGCGDGGRSTSYSCFCTRSSQEFNDIIATAVSKECKHSGAEVNSATSIFHDYCQLGNEGTSTTVVEVEASTTAEASSTDEASSTNQESSAQQAASTAETSSTAANPTSASKTASQDQQASNTSEPTVAEVSASLGTSSSITSTSSSASASTSSESSSGALPVGAKVAVGICVPVTILSLSALAFLLIRRRRKAQDNPVRLMLESRDQNQDFPQQKFAQELPGGHYFPRAYHKAELAGSTASIEAPGHESMKKYELA